MLSSIIERQKKRGGKSFLIQFYLKKKRRSIFLPSFYSAADAKSVAALIDDLVAAIESGGELPRRSSAILNTVGDDLRDRLEAADLIHVDKPLTLRELFDVYEQEDLTDKKPATIRNKKQARRRFFRFVDEEKNAEDFSKADAAEYAARLSKLVAEATRAGAIRDARRVFNWACGRGLLEKNPFDGIARGSFQNKSRETFIDRATFARLLDAAPSQEMRTLISLYRVGGLRKEEALILEWQDVDFDGRRMNVRSPKTERYRGRDIRVVPLFPELFDELKNLKSYEADQRRESPFVITKNRTTVRKKIEEVVFFAGLKPWERLIQNLRSSRAIEIYREFGALCEAEWLGHTANIAERHYLHVIEEDFDRATRTRGK